MSLRKAINDKCKECAYDPHDSGNWREQITMCTCTDCPLWPQRPQIGKTASKAQVQRMAFRMEQSGTGEFVSQCLGSHIKRFQL